MATFCNRIHGLKPAIMMITVQLSNAVVNVFYKLASNAGMSVKIMVAYRFMFASVAVLPLALYFERSDFSSIIFILSLFLLLTTRVCSNTPWLLWLHILIVHIQPFLQHHQNQKRKNPCLLAQ